MSTSANPAMAVVIPPRNLNSYIIDRSKMYSTNLEEIQAYIDGSIYNGLIDAKVIHDTNVHVDTHPNFTNYVMYLPDDEKMMVLRYYNIFDINKKMENILRKSERKVPDTRFIGSFVSGNHSSYVFSRDGLADDYVDPY
jgi:hypothetical protein